MTDPMPTLTGTEAANLKTLLNAQSAAVDFRIQQTIDADHDADSVPTVEDLPDGITPGQENWLGRSILVVADQQIYVITSLPSTWVRSDYLDRASTTPTKGAGWDTTGLLVNLMRRGGFAHLTFNGFRTSNLATFGTIVQIPPGYRLDMHQWTVGWASGAATDTFNVFYNPLVHEVQAGEAMPDNSSLAVSMTWPIL